MLGGNGEGIWSSGLRLAMFCRLLASTRMSLNNPQNSACENLASFCLPWFLVADKCGLVGKKGTPPMSGLAEQVDQTKMKQNVKLTWWDQTARELTCLHLATVDFFIQIHHQLLEHLVRNQLQLSTSDFQMLVNLNATLLRNNQMLTALQWLTG